MLKIKLPYGFKTISLDNLMVLYTGKIRLKHDFGDVVGVLDGREFKVKQHKNGCVCITWIVTDYVEHTNRIKQVQNLLRDVMINRIETKYGTGTNSEVVTDVNYYPNWDVDEELQF